MRVIIDSTNIYVRLAAEMINIESGRQLYDNGVRILEDEKGKETKQKSNFYPNFEIDGVVTSIRAAFGVLYLPDDLAGNAQMISKLMKTIEDMAEKENLNSYAALETGNEHFNVLRAKNNYRGTSITSLAETAFPQRRAVVGCKYFSGRDAYIAGARFNWFIFPISALILEAESYNSARIHPNTQLVSVLYDRDKLFRYADNELIIEQVTIYDIRFNYCDIIWKGKVSLDLIKSFPQSDDSIYSTTTSDYRKYHNYAGFVLSNYLDPSALMLCPIRRGGLEIARQLGKKPIFPGPVYALEQTVREFDEELPTFDRIDLCYNCETPLYGDIYLVFASITQKIGTPHCPICLHSIPYLCKRTDIVTRVKHPRGVNQVIDMMDVDDLVKNILRLSFGDVWIDRPRVNGDVNMAMFLGWDGSDTPDFSKVFIAWRGSMTSYICDYLPQLQKMSGSTVREATVFTCNVSGN